MKKFTYYVASLLLAGSLWTSCSDSDDSNQTIQLIGGTTTQQVVYADETNKNEGIKFTAAGPWTATVTEVNAKARASEVTWLTLSAYEGGAGEQKLTLTLQPNLTGADRAAEIAITCGETVIRIRVEQKGVKQDGQKPQGAEMKIVNKIIEKDEWNHYISQINYHDGRFSSWNTFADENKNGKVDANEPQIRSLYIESSSNNQEVLIHYEEKDAQNEYKTTLECTLNSDGYITDAHIQDYMNHQPDGDGEDLKVTYNQGYATECASTFYQSNQPYTDISTATWKDGNLVRINDGELIGNLTYNTKLLNNPKVSIDLNYVIERTEVSSCFPFGITELQALGFFGKRSSHMILKDEMSGGYSEINNYKYTTNSEGLITKIEFGSTVYEIFYESDELLTR